MNLFYESRLKASDSTPTYIVPTKSLLCGLCKLGVCGTIPREAKYGMDTPSNFLKLKENLEDGYSLIR